jgi:hypothetical protein
MDFITLRTNDEGRTVSIALSEKSPEHARLLGVLPHQTQFTREDLITFAREILDRLT